MNTDTRVQSLLNKIEEKKKLIKSTEKPEWVTNCSFQWAGNSTTNLHVADVETLLSIAAFLYRRRSSYNQVCLELGYNSKAFSHSGFTYDQWMADIKTRINIAELRKTRADLAALEEKVKDLMSPELKTQKALEEIEKLLAD